MNILFPVDSVTVVTVGSVINTVFTDTIEPLEPLSDKRFSRKSSRRGLGCSGRALAKHHKYRGKRATNER